MEPVKGGKLADIPEQGKAIFDALHGGSPASYAIRYAADFDGVFMVLSGMSSLEQMNDNLSFMKDFKPLSHEDPHHPLHRVPLLHGRLPRAYPYPRPVLVHELKAALPRLEFGLLL